MKHLGTCASFRGVSAVFASLLIMGITQAASGAVIRVAKGGNNAFDGSDWSLAKGTVQAAITAASAGGEVWVAKGVYAENITLKGGVAVYGGFAGGETARSQRNWGANVTVLDGNASGTVVTCPSGLTSTAAIDGFTIRNGLGAFGGGISCTSSSPTIANNTISGNSATYGGGIFCYYNSSPSISDNIITGNTASYGGGIECTSSSSPSIANNTITDNTAGYGGGIDCGSSSPTISSNTIAGNSAAFNGGGIECATSSSPTIVNNTVTGNSAPYGGGGIQCAYSSPTITNNTVTGNTASAGGGGIQSTGASPAISNNIVAVNSQGVFADSGGTPSLRNNDSFGNTGGNYSGLSAGTGDISKDPLFVSAATGDYHLTDASLCIDAGWSSAPGLPAVDKDGSPRIQGAAVDIGAYEHAPTAISVPAIGLAKAVADGKPVSLTAKVVTAVFTGAFYVEEPDRSAGIRVSSGIPVSVGNVVNISGAMATADGERQIVAAEVSVTSSVNPLAALTLSGRSVGGSDLDLQQGVKGGIGLSNIGLLIRTFGTVAYVDTGGQFFDIWDGSAVQDASGNNGVRIWAPGLQLPASGSFAVVTGISSCATSGPDLYPLVRVRGQGDIQTAAP